MPDGCVECRHFRRLRGIHKGESAKGWCGQVDDGYSNDCLLERLELVVLDVEASASVASARTGLRQFE